MSGRGAPPHPFTFSLGSMAPTRETKGGSVRIADSTNFTVSTSIAAALLTSVPAGCAKCIGTPTLTNGSTGSKAKAK